MIRMRVLFFKSTIFFSKHSDVQMYTVPVHGTFSSGFHLKYSTKYFLCFLDWRRWRGRGTGCRSCMTRRPASGPGNSRKLKKKSKLDILHDVMRRVADISRLRCCRASSYRFIITGLLYSFQPVNFRCAFSLCSENRTRVFARFTS
jgi:hypothetical protein